MLKKIINIIIVVCIMVMLPCLTIAGVDEDLKKNLGNHDFIKSWSYNKSAFKLYLNPELCKENQASAALLTIRYIFEANRKQFPMRIEIYNNKGKKMSSYPFANIPSLTK